MEVAITALRLDEILVELKKEESQYKFNDLLTTGISRYKKEFFFRLKELLKERDKLPESNQEKLLNFFINIAIY